MTDLHDNSRVTGEAIISEIVIVLATHLHNREGQSKDKVKLYIIVANTTSYVTQAKAEMTKTALIHSDLEVETE